MVGLLGLKRFAVTCAVSLFVFACASANDDGHEAIGSATQEITAACTGLLVGMPCDPDGGGAKTECEGICWLNGQAQVSCRAVSDLGMTAASLNGRVCGSPDGADCSRSCDSGTCSDRNASVAAACRPAPGENVCAGACTLVGANVECQPAARGCADAQQNGCKLTACDYTENTKGCVDVQVTQCTAPAGGGTNGAGGSQGVSGGASGGSGANAGGMPQAGSTSTGGSSAGTSGGLAGSATTGGSGTATAPLPTPPSSPEFRGGGCSCQTWGSATTPSGWLAAMFVAALLCVRRHRALRGVFASIMGVVALFSTSPARAQSKGFAIDPYPGPASPADLLWLERADVGGGHLRPFARLTLSYADDLLVMNQGDTQTRIVDSQLAVHGSAGLVLWDKLQAALLVPVVAGNGLGNVNGTHLGNPGLDVRYRVLDRKKAVEVALAGTVRFPLGSSDALAANDTVSFYPRAIVSRSILGSGFIGGSLGVDIRGATTVGDIEPGSELQLTAGGLIPIVGKLGATAEVALGAALTDFGAAGHVPLEGTVGARYEVGPVVLGAGLGAGLSNGYGAPDVRALATVGFLPAAKLPTPGDRDGDGVRDENDKCPNDEEDRDSFQDEDGCPDPDNDADGIADSDDKCPNEAETKNGNADTDGCPDAAGDKDGDGIPDVQDKCVDAPEDRDGWQDDDGCPEPDNDGDGIADATDKCPNEAETKNGKDDDDGCPDLVRVEKGKLTTLEPIYFEYNSDKIAQRSLGLLDEIAKVLTDRRDLGKVRIAGHTDSAGADEYNLRLSRERAQAVLAYLATKGVERERLSAEGFGETQPIADNGTEVGRSKNRRVEFILSDQK